MKEADEEAFLWLPEGIIHRILSFLDVQEQVKVSVLSKDWLSAWHTNPNLIFNERKLQDAIEQKHPELEKMFEEGHVQDPKHHSLPAYCERYVEKHHGMMIFDEYEIAESEPCCPICYRHFVEETFQEFVENTLTKRKDHDINRVDFFVRYGRRDMRFFEKWLGKAVGKRAKEISIAAAVPNSFSYYAIPNFILAAESLTKLSLLKCKVSDCQLINCKNLQSLTLRFVWIDDSTFRSLIAGCSLITHLEMLQCDGFKTIKLTNLPCLQYLYIEGIVKKDDDNVRVQIDAPSLEAVDLTALVRPQFLGRPASPNLRRLGLYSVRVATDFFDNFMDKFPQLQSLYVGGSMLLQKINLKSHSLKRLTLILAENAMRDLKLAVPNLIEFEFSNKGIPTIPLRTASADLTLSSLVLGPNDSTVDALWFQRMNEMLLNLVPSRIDSLALYGIKFPLQKENKTRGNDPSFVAFPVKNLKIVDESPSSKFNSRFLDVMFLAYRPRAISWPVLTDRRAEKIFNCLLRKLREMQNQHLKGFDIYVYKRDRKGNESEEYLPEWKISPSLPISFENAREIRIQLEWDLFLYYGKVGQTVHSCTIGKLTITMP